jgi:hypothetical protein
MKRSFLKKEIVSIVVKFNLNKAEEQIQIIKGLFFEVCFNVENKLLVCMRTGFIRIDVVHIYKNRDPSEY